jgi:hypothetical protein
MSSGAGSLVPKHGMWCQDTGGFCQLAWWCTPLGFLQFMVGMSLLMAVSFVLLMLVHPLVKGFIERRPSKYPDEATASWFAWHVQSTIHASSQVWFSYWSIWHLSSSTPLNQFGVPDVRVASETDLQAIASAANGSGVFFAYIFVDCFIAVYRKQMTVDYLAHHLVFMFFCVIIMYDCFAPYLAGSLLMMETSTIFLNIFSFTRNRLGYGHIFVKMSFLLFAVFFVIIRLGGQTYIALYFSRSVITNVPDYGGIPRWHLYGVMLGSILGIGIQLFWGYEIAKKLLRVMKSPADMKANHESKEE